MKTILIGNQPFKLLEDTKEISARRNLEIELYKLQGYHYGADTGDVLNKLEQYKKGFDAGKMADCLIYLHELHSGINQVYSHYNPFHYIFALLVLDEEEVKQNANPNFLSNTYLSEKLQSFYDLDLKEAVIEETVANFLMSSAENVEAALLKTLQVTAR
jgi:hypothetical protein